VAEEAIQTAATTRRRKHRAGHDYAADCRAKDPPSVDTISALL
jgi:hypothetical protein